MSILKVSIRQIKAGRALLNWSQAELAEFSGVSEPTIKRLESIDGDLGGRPDTVSKILACMEQAGIIFFDGEYSAIGGPGVRLRDRQP